MTIARIEHRRQLLTAYNLSVDGPHTYRAGDSHLLVHNCPATNREWAEVLQKRAAEIQSQRGFWASRMGTTAVFRVRNRTTGKIRTFIAIEGYSYESRVRLIKPLLQDDDKLIAISKRHLHAEQKILMGMGSDWELVAGGTSRNICHTCSGALAPEGSGLRIGGPRFRGRSDKTPFRMVWRA